MSEFLSNLYSSSSVSAWSALLLGFMTAISPCPLASNITAMGYISKDIENRNRVFYSGLVYTLGRVVSYTLLALILFIGADQFKVSEFFQRYGEKILGPVLILISLFMLGVIKINFGNFLNLSSSLEKKKSSSYLNVFLLGLLFALAFCPYSGVLYFGILIPMTIQSTQALYLPVIFAIATGIPVILFAWLLAYTVSGVGKFYNKLKSFEIWFRRVVAFLFLATGTYLTIVIWLVGSR